MPNLPVAPTQPQGADPWLRGNVRPVLVAAAATMLSGSLIITVLIAFAAPAWLQGVVGVLLAAGTATTAALAVESGATTAFATRRHADDAACSLA